MLLCNLSKQDRIDIFNEAETQMFIVSKAIEKDWWVCIILKALFSTKFYDYLVFKGGTSLSKGWHLIERFSEDIDISIQREYLGFGNTLSKTQISNRLRRASCSFVRTDLKNAVSDELLKLGVPAAQFNISVEKTAVTTVDPERIFVEYESVFDDPVNTYIHPSVIIEAGARSIYEPASRRTIKSFISELFPNQPFSDTGVVVHIAPAERTFLEKAFLLHEEFHKPEECIRSERMSRHLYDLERMMDTPISKVIGNTTMYHEIVDHRKRYFGLKGFNYDTLDYGSIDFVPPETVAKVWKQDYQAMRESIIYGPSLTYESLIARIQELNRIFHHHATDSTSKFP